MSTTLPLFWHLSSGSTKQRIDASVKLVGALEQFQVQFVPKDPLEVSGSDDEGEGDDETRTDQIDVLNAHDVSYSIRRLIRGLASPRESSRLGFAVALTELLSRLDTVTCSQILALLTDATKPQGSMTGQEERDVIFARLFGLTAIIQSGLIVRTKPLPFSASSETSASSVASFREAVSNLIALGEKKSWLRESAWWSLGLAIDALNASDVPWKAGALDATAECVFSENTAWSPEKVAITLKLQSINPDRNWRKLLCPTFKTPDLLASTNLLTLGRILKETGTEADSESVPKSAASSWKPQLHFVWSFILDQLLPGPNSTVFTKGSFQEFFRVVVDESLFSATSSQERKYSGFQVFQKALPRVTESIMPMLFTKNFMRSWINHLSHPDRYLHKVARQVATDIQAFVQKQPQLGFALILQLTGVNGSQQFDKLTKSRTVESILTSMDGDGIKSYISHLIAQVNPPTDQEDSDVQVINLRRAWIIDQLSALIRNGAVPKEDAWIMSILDWLTVNGLFIVKKKSEKSPFLGLHKIPSPPFSDLLRQQCRTRLLGCLADLSGQTRSLKLSDDRAIKCPAIASDGEFWVSKIITTIEQLKADPKRVTLLADSDEDDTTLHSKVKNTVGKLRGVSGAQSEAAKGVEFLLLGTLLLHYAEEQPDLDTATLEDCLDASTRMFFLNAKSKSKKLREEAETPEDAPLEPVDLMVDTIIGFLEKSTAYMRAIGNQVFSLLSSSVQGTTIDLILSQLERRDPSELARDGESGDGDTADEEAGSDSESEVSDDMGEESSDGEVDLELRHKIEEALRINGVVAATGDSDDDSEEEPMDDEQMLAVDEQLAQVFRMRESEKKGKKVDAQREATHFKNRVLDLVDTFAKKEPTSPHIIALLLPLVELSTGTSSDERHLTDKAKGILRSRIAKSKEGPSHANVEEVKLAMNQLHTRARKMHSPELLATLSQCSLYVTKVLIEADVQEAVLDAYRESLEDFTTRKNSALNNSFFLDAIRRYPSTMWMLRQDVLSLSSKAVNGYRRSQSLQLLQALVTRLPPATNQQETIDFMLSFRDVLVQSVTDACEEKIVMTPQQMKDLLKLGSFGVRQTQRVASEAEARKVWNPEAWGMIGQQLANSERFKGSVGLQKMCQKLSGSQTQPASAKRKAVTDTSGEAEVDPPKVKRKKTRN
ncbi:DNA polymerase phi-domain-containing protein [Mycena maculata]|uniref:DNA polymerase phi-domain-containing protein n=1 Tax=Mycena maculata TaxID=230809 RepID=A0AAD7N0R1_9AGAR|nr:DNA polymerase phi-domain-containing protein [Mycena maculata]